MKKFLLAAALAAAFLPACAHAQSAGNGPSPEVRAQIDQARSDALQNSMKALSDDHRAKVLAIVAQVQSGALAREDAQKQIDALLTPDESKAVIAQDQKLRDAMRAAFQSQGGGGGMGGGGRFGGGHRGGGQTPDAGGVLLMLNSTGSSPSGSQ